MTQPIDVDDSWDGTGSLDDHRQKMFAQITQPGFGGSAKPPEPDTVSVPDTDIAAAVASEIETEEADNDAQQLEGDV